MPLQNGRMTPREARFADVYARTGDVGYASARAGYAQPSGGSMALQRGPIQDRVAAIRAQRAEQGIAIAFDTLEEIARNRSAPAGARVQAADKLLKGSGIYQLAPGEDAEGKQLHEMSAAELTATIKRLEASQLALSNQAKVIEHEAEPSFLD